MAIIIAVAVAIIAGIDNGYSTLRPDRFAYCIITLFENETFLDEVDKISKNLSGLGLVMR